ncbi:nucleoside-diphosphate kinase [Deferribacterales bacterium RsTz2092]|nr:nucleoside diphosphate kinase [Deferribacterales bacterium]
MEKTFAIIKPDAVKAGNSGSIISRIEQAGLKILGMRKLTMARSLAEHFYAVHKSRPFFGELINIITAGPCIVLALEGKNAIVAWRELIGATDPAKADKGTLRQLYGTDISYNAVHGSDAPETADAEIRIFFKEADFI